MQRLCAAAFFVFSFAIAVPSLADGIIVYRALDEDIREPQQKAFIVHADGMQDLVLSVKFEGAAGDFGWLVPLPARPEMEPAEGPIFGPLSKKMQLPFVVGRDLSPLKAGIDGMRPGVKATFHDVGIYDVALLDGTDGAALQAWLEMHAFVLPPDSEIVLDEYARKGWTIAAIRIDPELMDETTGKKLSSGVIQPILFRFPADEPVFPLRISSLGGHESEVLLYVLADRPLRPRGSRGVDWQVALRPWNQGLHFIPHFYWAEPDYDPTVYYLPAPGPSYLRDVYGRFYDQRDELWLTKCRATFEPQQMVDLAFEEHDAVAALSSDDTDVRGEAIGYLATLDDQQAVDALIGFLSDQEFPQDECDEYVAEHRGWPWPGQDIRSAAWALGQLGDPRAVPELERWATCGRPLYQYEALIALREIDPRRACDIALEFIEHGDRVSKHDHCGRVLYHAAVTTVIGQGGPELDERVRRLVDRRIDPNPVEQVIDGVVRPRLPFDLDLRADAMAIAAASGDEFGTQVLYRELGEDATFWLAGLADGDTVSGAGGTNHYPGSLRPLTAYAALRRLNGVTKERRGAFRALEKLSLRPAARDEILRRLGSDDSHSILARALFYGELSEATDGDAAAIERLWTAARRHPRRVYVVFPGNRRGRLCPFADVFDLDACAIAYAACRIGREDMLLDWWREIPWTEPHLKGEMLAAMSMAGYSEDKPEALYDATIEYMRQVWNARILKLDREGCYDAGHLARRGKWPYRNAFENDFRQGAIVRIFGSRQRARSADLIEDMTLDPAIQLFWLLETWHWLRRGDPERLNRLLDDLETRLEDPVLLTTIHQLEALIAERDERDAARVTEPRGDVE